MKRPFPLLALTALVVCGCSPPSTPPEPPVLPLQETQTEQTSTQTEQTSTQTEQTPTQTEQTSANARSRPSQAPVLNALRRRQAKAERLVAENDFADAAREADYVASQIRVAELDRRGADGDGQDAQEYAALLESALKTLEECSRRSETSNRGVSSSETTSVLL